MSYAAERLRLEFDSEKIGRSAIIRRIQALGYAVLEEGREAGWFAEYRELIFNGVAGGLARGSFRHAAQFIAWP